MRPSSQRTTGSRIRSKRVSESGVDTARVVVVAGTKVQAVLPSPFDADRLRGRCDPDRFELQRKRFASGGGRDGSARA